MGDLLIIIWSREQLPNRSSIIDDQPSKHLTTSHHDMSIASMVAPGAWGISDITSYLQIRHGSANLLCGVALIVMERNSNEHSGRPDCRV